MATTSPTDNLKPVDELNYFELLAWLGIGSSHPGGFPATLKNLNIMDIKAEDLLLDAGCGSGLTACYLAKTKGCRVIGVDINPQMIEKARLRAEHENITHLVDFKVADVYDLPFPDNHFDWVLGESITVFLDKVKVYQEFLRVLKPEGHLADLEMALLQELPSQIRSQMEECYGKGTDPLPFQKWVDVLAEAGFVDVEVKNPQALQNTNSNLIVNALKHDWLLLKDLVPKVTNQPQIYRRLQNNANFMKRYKSYFGFGLLYAKKPLPPEPPPKPSLIKSFTSLLKKLGSSAYPFRYSKQSQ